MLTADCSYSGSWVKDLKEFLDEHEVQPCGHSAREKGILMKVKASCEPNRVPFCLLNSVRANENDKNNSMLRNFSNGWQVAEGQHLYSVDPTLLQCGKKSIDGCCALSLTHTWQRQSINERVHFVKGKDKGRRAWYYILLTDDEDVIRQFHERVNNSSRRKLGLADIARFGKVLKSGRGREPPNEVRDWIEKEYAAVYT